MINPVLSSKGKRISWKNAKKMTVGSDGNTVKRRKADIAGTLSFKLPVYPLNIEAASKQSQKKKEE
jgi:hypothetical protein